VVHQTGRYWLELEPPAGFRYRVDGMKTLLRLLLIEDNDDDAAPILRTPANGGFDKQSAMSASKPKRTYHATASERLGCRPVRPPSSAACVSMLPGACSAFCAYGIATGQILFPFLVISEPSAKRLLSLMKAALLTIF